MPQIKSSAYRNLMETFMPTSDDDSWDDFFELAIQLRNEFQAEVYDAFDYDNVRNYLEW